MKYRFVAAMAAFLMLFPLVLGLGFLPVNAAAPSLRNLRADGCSANDAGGVSSTATEMIFANDNRILYLPAAADLTNLTLWFDADDTVVFRPTDNKNAEPRPAVSGQAMDFSACLSRDSDDKPCYRVSFVIGESTKNDYTFYVGSTLGSVYLKTTLGIEEINSSKQTVDAGVNALIVNPDGSTEYDSASVSQTCAFRARGNATFSYQKKAYQIKLGEKVDLYGMGKAKTWLLIANYIDQSLLRNAVCYHMGELLGLTSTPSLTFVDLYIDGVYYGIYALTEKVQIGEERVEISSLEDANEEANPGLDFSALFRKRTATGSVFDNTNLSSFYSYSFRNPADITGGYLVELDNLYYADEPSRFTYNDTDRFVVKSPEYASDEQMAYIAGLFAEMEEAILSADGYNRLGRHYSEYIDIDSLACAYLVAEWSKNWDGFYSSTFFYKDADKNGVTSKIYAGPLWDFDNTLGNINDGTFSTDVGELWVRDRTNGRVKQLAENLMRHPEFEALVAQYYQKILASVQEMTAPGGWIDQAAAALGTSQRMEQLRWRSDIYSRWPLNAEGTHVGRGFFQFREVYSDGQGDNDNTTTVGYLKYFLRERTEELTLSIGYYRAPSSYYSITVDNRILDVVSASCTLVKRGNRASLHITDSTLLSRLRVTDAQGNLLTLTPSDTGSSYESGTYVFTMPTADVNVTMEGLPEIDATQNENPMQTEPESTKEEGSPAAPFAKTLWMIGGIVCVLLVVFVLVFIFYLRHSRKKKY